MIGIKLADGTFYPILQDEKKAKKRLSLTTVENGQTTVQVDLYRSENNSIDDAEYVDSLIIKNLIPHEKSEPEIPLVIGLDENNVLSAELSDTESGNKSNMSVSLVTLTNDKLKAVPDYNIVNPENPPKQDSLSLENEQLPSSTDLNSDSDFSGNFEMPDFNPTDFNPTLPQIDTPISMDETADFDLPEIVEPADESKISELPNTVDLSDKPTDDFSTSFDIPESPTTENSPSFEDELSSLTDSKDDDFDFSNDNIMELGENIEPTPISETAKDSEIENTNDLPMPDDLPASDDLLPVDDSIPTENTSDINNPFPEINDAQEIQQNPISSLDEPAKAEIEPTAIPDQPVSNSNDSDNSSISSIIDDLPDFDIPSETISTLPQENLPEASDSFTKETVSPDTDNYIDSLDNTNTPVFDTSYSSKPIIDKKPAKIKKSKAASKKNASDDSEPMLGFQDLYDEETIKGMNQTDSKKITVPMIICIICAIISVIALAAIIFFVPSNIDIKIKHQQSNTTEEVTEKVIDESKIKEPLQEPTEILSQTEKKDPLPEVIPAAPIENTIVIAETPEIVPIIPPVEQEKTKDVTYKIKWGDTLWDLADAYYKNPWKYHKIAKANNIKDPDYIISGTIITIPID